MANPPTVTPRSRVGGDQRTALAAQLRSAYEAGATIRALADVHRRSYGFVDRLLVESRTRSGTVPAVAGDE